MKLGMEGKLALVTGAAQGIGEAAARALAAEGAVIAALDRDAGRLEEAVSRLRQAGAIVHGYAADAGDGEAVERVVAQAEEKLGPIGILVHAAGILRTGPLVEMKETEWAELLRVNCGGTFHVCRAVARRMGARRMGAIVVVASNAAGVPRMEMGAYAASKAAVVMLTKCLALELAGQSVRCNSVSPGSTDTPMQRSLWTGAQAEQAVIDGSPQAYKAGIPLRKLATPADVADAIVFLASDKAAHITMHDMVVDGGATLGV